jgi:hypothetical protein
MERGPNLPGIEKLLDGPTIVVVLVLVIVLLGALTRLWKEINRTHGASGPSADAGPPRPTTGRKRPRSRDSRG